MRGDESCLTRESPGIEAWQIECGVPIIRLEVHGATIKVYTRDPGGVDRFSEPGWHMNEPSLRALAVAATEAAEVRAEMESGPA